MALDPITAAGNAFSSLTDFGKISSEVRWGGDWNNNTELKDNSFDDLVHFELI